LIENTDEVGIIADYYVEAMSIILADVVKEEGRAIQVRWEYRSTDGVAVFTQIYRDGVPVGIERTTESTDWLATWDYVMCYPGSSIELWAKRLSLAPGQYVRVKHLRITGDCTQPVNEISGTTKTEG